MTSRQVNDLEQELRGRIRELSVENDYYKRVYEITNALGSERNIDKLLPLILTEISKFLHADRSTLFLIDYENRFLWTKFAEGMSTEKIIVKMKMGLVGSCLLTRKIVNVADAYDALHFNPEIDEISGYRTESVLCVPFFNKNNQVAGALELLNKKTGVFVKEDEESTLKTAAMITSMDMMLHGYREKAKDLVHRLRDEIQAERSALFLLDREKGELRSIMADNIDGEVISLNLNVGIAGLVAVTGEDINIADAYSDRRFDKSVDERTGYRTNSLLCVPLRNQAGEILGVIEILNKIDGVFFDHDREFLKLFASHVAIFIENALLFEEQNRQFKSVLAVLAASIDAKDP